MKIDLLNRIANHLIMHASLIQDVGLYHGKMGIVLFFAHYARFSGDTKYDDFAGELLEEICEELHEDIPVNFEYGLCGIGWGIEYLYENKFIEGDSNEILFEIDQKVMELNVKRMTNFTIRTGLGGLILYVDKRINSFFGKRHYVFDASYISDIQTKKKDIENLPKNPLLEIISNIDPDNDHIIIWKKLGLENGCAGVGLNKILK